MFLQKTAPILRAVGRRSYSLWRPYRWNMLADMEQNFRDFDRFVPRPFWSKHWVQPVAIRSPFVAEEDFRMVQPIVEEDGVKKFKLIFDVSHFKPEEINVKTNKGKVIVEAKHQSKTDNSEAKYEYFREFAIPEGVKIEEMTCKYTEDGSLLVEAPYTPPPKVEKEKDIPIKHE